MTNQEQDQTNRIPLIGERFPEMHVVTTHGPQVLPRYYKGKWMVLFSHPADYTPVCTTEFAALAKRIEEFRALNTELIGLSMDQVFSHIKWLEWIKEKLGIEVTFPVIADSKGHIATRLGMLQPGRGSSTVRAVFIVDPNSFIRLVLYYPSEVGRKTDEILRTIKALQLSDQQNVSTPADWPENDLIENKVVLPPAKDVDSAEKRKNCENSYDWWFCYKDPD